MDTILLRVRLPRIAIIKRAGCHANDVVREWCQCEEHRTADVTRDSCQRFAGICGIIEVFLLVLFTLRDAKALVQKNYVSHTERLAYV